MNTVQIIAVTAIPLTLCVCSAEAAAEFPESPGFSGYLQVLAGAYDSEGLANISKGNERIQSLGGDAKSASEDLFVPLWQVKYTFADANTSVFLGTTEQNSFQLGLNLEMGASHSFRNGTIVTAAYTPKVSELDEEVWQDPYLVGGNRARSKSSVEAFHLSFENIINTGLSFGYGVGEEFVEDDLAGESQRSRLKASQIKQLRRGGDFDQAYLSGIYSLSHNFYFLPRIAFEKVDANGDANRYESIGGNITIVYEGERLEWYVDHSYAKADYDHKNPVFNQKRKDKNYGISAGVSFLRPFDWKHVSFDLVGGEARRKSNIHFFKTRDKYLALGMTYRF